ncbi:MAG TPA: hypothetical protein VND64_26480 [Pirellulales bacterium]|nr:hypothetical protein [Pirellulales bacterium]
MFKHIHLWWLELRLESHLGKYDAYLNKVYDEGAITDDNKLRIALETLRSPPLNKGQRWAEHQKLVGRQMGVLPVPKPAPITAPKRGSRWSGAIRVVFRTLKGKTAKPVVIRGKDKEHAKSP